jgi:hypothetical protein
MVAEQSSVIVRSLECDRRSSARNWRFACCAPTCTQPANCRFLGRGSRGTGDYFIPELSGWALTRETHEFST